MVQQVQIVERIMLSNELSIAKKVNDMRRNNFRCSY